jgi:hypothetical protein
MAMSDTPIIQPYDVILAEARLARDIGESLSSVTHALCAIGLDLIQHGQRLEELLAEINARVGEGGDASMSDPIRDLAAKATPGPWTWEADGFDTHIKRGRFCITSALYNDTVSDRANARLIALAPDLARVAPDLAESLRWQYELHGIDPVGCAALAAYRALQERAKEPT